MSEFIYLTNCVQSKGEDITAMVETSRQITYRTFMEHVGIDEVKDVFPFYRWGRGAIGKQDGHLRLKDDYAISFHKGKYLGEDCYYIVHSAIEYIFTRARNSANVRPRMIVAVAKVDMVVGDTVYLEDIS